MTSGRSSSRSRCSSVARFFKYGSSRMSSSDRPDRCSRMMYAASASPLLIEPRAAFVFSRLPKNREKKPPVRGARSPGTATARLYPCLVGQPDGARFAERIVHGIGEDGGREEILIWIERRPGAVWAAGRAINLRHRSNPV